MIEVLVGLYVRVWCDRSVGWPLCESGVIEVFAGVGLYVRVWCDRSVGWGWPLCESVV